jgi:hypothetical protein
MKKFNINSEVKVRLTDVGRSLHKKSWEELYSIDNTRIPSYIPPQEDEQGYSRFVMWELMQIFGSYLTMGCEIPFETTVLIDESCLK